VVDYFTSTRELAGMRRLADDDIADRLASQQVRTRRRRPGISELTSRMPSSRIAATLAELERRFDPEFDSSAALAEFRRDPAAVKERSENRLPALDILLATSMLQVGVDVQRLGLMVVTGQPKNTAEYIQASSRVGRVQEKPGLVVTLYNWSRPRDLAHYEDFGYHHATFYRQVEALSVTPYTRRALDRGTAATFIAAVRNRDETWSRDADAQDVPLDGPVVAGVTGRMLDRAVRAGGPRGRDYLAERIAALRDRWELAKTGSGSARLGYRDRPGNRPLRGLLDMATGAGWHELTVPMSMRETENEINLLVPGAGLRAPVLGQPAWSFAAAADGEGEDAPGADDVPDADELGESALDPADGGR
jgi:hypothetical protein